MRTGALILAGVLAAVAACGPAAPRVTAQHAAWAQSQWPTATQAELEHGRTLYMQKCSGCHRPPAPTDHAPADWPGEVAEMRERAHLEPDEATLIERYVVTLASAR